MQSICWTTRLVTRALRSGFSTLVEPSNKVKPHFVSVACGFPKDFLRSKYKLGRFGEDAWFIASTQHADVIGKFNRKKQTKLDSEFMFIDRVFYFPLKSKRFSMCFFSIPLSSSVLIAVRVNRMCVLSGKVSVENRRNENAQVTKGVLVVYAFFISYKVDVYIHEY